MQTNEYHRLAKIENSHWWYKSLHRLLLETIKNLFKSTKKIKILDAGCGTGGFTNQLLLFGQVTGLDISPLALDLAKKKYPKIKFIKSSVNKLSFNKNLFDLVTSISVLYHRQVNDLKALKEIYRVLKPKGYIIIVLPAFSWAYSHHDQAVHGKKRYTLSQATSLLKKSGFKITYARYLFSFLFPIFLIKRMIEKLTPTSKTVSDLTLPHKLMNSLFYWFCRLEWLIANRYFRLPFGSSIIIVAQKA